MIFDLISAGRASLNLKKDLRFKGLEKTILISEKVRILERWPESSLVSWGERVGPRYGKDR